VLVTNGDGLELRGKTLYVVENFDNTVSYFTLRAGLTEAEKIGEFTTADRTVLDVPTTATLTLGALWVVNARFGTTPTLDTPYWITRLPAQP
jgi:hypothetical protein